MTKIAPFGQKSDIVLFVKDKPLLKFVNIQLLIPKTLNLNTNEKKFTHLPVNGSKLRHDWTGC